ncbi:PIN domain-containing protein [Ruania zhangjianzhongii]|uniref:PIN domain-containing protein n=1 Tax=Ruania zhangjianzhongii TaxID=2603206 RepID=UPI0011CB5448|nr:PIN domain-containing protein [Ruania zhangjianzhongii]
MSGFRVILDACVLVPITKADLLLQLANRRAFHPLWSPRILDEVTQAIPSATKGRVTDERAQMRVQMMNNAFEDALVDDRHGLEQHITGPPDSNDRHVVAAAIHGRAAAIVTDNIKDFPEAALIAMSEQRKNPPETVDGLLRSLSRAGLPDFTNEVWSALET